MKELLFKNLNLKDELNKALEDLGFEYATEIQESSIPPLLGGEDVVGLSQTGSGKTLAFAIPAIEMCDQISRQVQTLIMCPTRELAMQIEEVFKDLLKYNKEIKVVCLYGGSSIDTQIRKLKTGVQIVVGTPGRIMDHIKRKTLRLESTKFVVLDEADEMLNMGFKEDVEAILVNTPHEKQVALFSATMPAEIRKISQSFQTNPILIKTSSKGMTVDSIEQYYVNVKSANKATALLNLIYKHNPKTALVFANTKKMVDELVDQLKDKDIKISGLHGDMSQNERTKVMDSFKRGKINILVASDVAARGIDVNNIEIVFNYDLPQNQEYYVHRIGRCGRAGNTGISYTFINGRKQLTEMMQIIKNTNSECKEANLPTKKEIIKATSESFINTIKGKLKKDDYNEYSFISKALLDEGYEAAKIIEVLSSMILNLSINEVTKENLNVKLDNKNITGDMTRLIIFLGKNDRVSASNIVCALAEEVGLTGNMVGKIDVLDKFSFVDVPSEYANLAVEKLSVAKIRNQNVKIEIKAGENKFQPTNFKIDRNKPKTTYPDKVNKSRRQGSSWGSSSGQADKSRTIRKKYTDS